MNQTDKLLIILKQLFKRQGYTLYPYQQKWCKDSSKHKILNKSRQVGMSDVCAAWTLLNAYFLEKTELIISPSLRQSKHFMDYIYKYKQLLEDELGEPLLVREETKTSIIFETGGEIYSLPNSASTVRGFKADDIIFDEFAHFLHGTDKEIMTALLPSVSRGGTLSIISTPFGTENLYYMIWTDENNYSKHLINWRDCPDLDKNEIERIQTVDPLTFQQEYNNQFLEDVDEAEFPFSLIRKCIDMELEYEELTGKKIYVGGADIGRKQDLTAVAIFEYIDGIYFLRHTRTMKNIRYKEQENFFKWLLQNHTFQNFCIDATGIGSMLAEYLLDDFGDVIQPVEFTSEVKENMVMNLKENMFNDRVRIPNDPQLINNIRSIKRMYTSGGYLRFDSDRNSEIGHADLFWALALALYQEKGGTTEFLVG